jgi:hypothetical protein
MSCPFDLFLYHLEKKVFVQGGPLEFIITSYPASERARREAKANEPTAIC